MLCQYNKDIKLGIPYGEEGRNSRDVYSAKDDKFILSPLDGPTALSMKVSLSAPPFQSRPDADLDFDPHAVKGWIGLVNIVDPTASKKVKADKISRV